MSIFCYTKYVIICALAVMLWFPAHASELALDDIADYQQLFEHMEDTARDAEISPLTRRCTWFDRGTFMAVSPACFLQENLPSLAYEDVLPTLTPWIEDVSAVYDTQADAFWYQGANVEWKDDLVTLDDWPVVGDVMLLQQFAHHGVMIQVPKHMLAYEQLQDYALFAAVRDTTTYGPCRKKNYDVAMSMLHGFVLAPHEQLNMNELIANHPDYCTGTAGKFLFYQGVCGGSTQLFWNALVNPYLYVVERSAHGEFRKNFYGHMGEDAGIYERSKQLIIENIGTGPVVFGTFVREDGNTVLLSTYPEQEGLRSYVQKQQTGRLSADLMNTVTNHDGTMKYKQERTSNYWGVNNTSDL